jgi:uncharacterized protein YkwD
MELRRPGLRRTLLCVPVALALTAAPANAACGISQIVPTVANLSGAASSTLCLINAERTRRGLVALKRNKKLDKAALRHSRDMVNRHYFAHETPEGGTFIQRILAAKYVTRRTSWTVGENLGWGSGLLSTPAQVVVAWMNSPGHRANILKAAYREIGIGIVPAAPVINNGFRTVAGVRTPVHLDIPGATYSTEFGVRYGSGKRAKR